MPSPKPLIEELEKWVTWRAWTYETPSCWQELGMVPGVDDHEKLPHEVWASFRLPQRASEWCQVENDHQAPLALQCLCHRSFLPLPNSNFTCRDIWELQQEKTVAYAQALQFWVEKDNLPTRGKPHLLVGSIVELWEEMKCYFSFSEEDVFSGVALLEEPPIIPPKEATPKGTQPTPANPPVKEVTVDVTMEPTAEKKCPNQFPGWEKVLHPSRPIIATGKIPPLLRGPKQRPHSWNLGEKLVWHPQTDELRVLATQLELPLPTKESEVVWWVMPPPGFVRVTACLQRDQSLEGDSKVPPDPLRMAVLSGPAMATMNTSCIVKDEVMGVTYMDTMTTLVWQVTLSGPRQEAFVQGPTIQDVMDLM